MEQMVVIVCINAFMLALILFGLMREFRLMRLYSERLSSRVKQLEGEKERLDYERAALARALNVKADASPPGAEPDRGRLGDMQNKALTLWNQERATSVSRDASNHAGTVFPDGTLAAPSCVSVQSSGCGLTPRQAAAQDVTRAPPPPRSLGALLKEPIATPTAEWLPLFRRSAKGQKPLFAPTSPSSMPGRPGFLV